MNYSLVLLNGKVFFAHGQNKNIISPRNDKMTELQITPLMLTSIIGLDESYEINYYWDQTSVKIKRLDIDVIHIMM